jgi:hypothetical protein
MQEGTGVSEGVQWPSLHTHTFTPPHLAFALGPPWRGPSRPPVSAPPALSFAVSTSRSLFVALWESLWSLSLCGPVRLRGTKKHVLLPLRVGTLRFFSGRERMAARGANIHVLMLLVMATWRSISGREPTAARGMNEPAPPLLLKAAHNGQLEILQWARANGCPWNEYTCSYAARNGHLEIHK